VGTASLHFAVLSLCETINNELNVQTQVFDHFPSPSISTTRALTKGSMLLDLSDARIGTGARTNKTVNVSLSVKTTVDQKDPEQITLHGVPYPIEFNDIVGRIVAKGKLIALRLTLTR